MDNNTVFKSYIVEAASPEEAVKKTPFKHVFVNATAAYVNILEHKGSFNRNDWFRDNGGTPEKYKNFLIRQGLMTESEFKEWQIFYTRTKTQNADGMACVIVLKNAVKNKKHNPYSYHNIKVTGKRKFKKYTEIVNSRTGEVLWSGVETKKKTVQRAKNILASGNITDDLILRTGIEMKNPVVGRLEYKPSKNTTNGKYIVFGAVSE